MLIHQVSDLAEMERCNPRPLDPTCGRRIYVSSSIIVIRLLMTYCCNRYPEYGQLLFDLSITFCYLTTLIFLFRKCYSIKF